MNKFLFVIGFLILAAMAAVAIGPSFVDWSSYRGTFEREASRLVGREVRVGGDVQLRVFPSAYLQFENVRVASADGRFVDPFLKAARFKLMLEIPPLLKGTFKARRVEIDEAHLLLAVDENGRGLWSKFRSSDGRIVPKAVELPDVRILNSTLGFRAARGQDRSQGTEISNIEGIFSAATLDGPYKFSGTIGDGKGQKSVRVSTGPLQNADQGQKMDLVGQLGDPSRSAVYRLKGVVDANLETPQFNGALEATYSAAGYTSQDNSDIEVKSRVSVTTSGVQIGDIEAGFETAGRPQVVNGDAVVSWRKSLSVMANFSAAWIDLNRFDTTKDTTAVALVRKFQDGARWLTGMAPGDGSVKVSGTLKQASFREGSINNVRFEIARGKGGLEIKTVEASLPGAGRLTLSGTLRGASAEQTEFDGRVALRGGSLKRFTSWALATPGGASAPDRLLDIGKDGFFSLRSRLRSTSREVQLTNVDAEFSGARVGGDLYRAYGQPSENATEAGDAFNLTLKSGDFDLASVGLAQPSPDVLMSAITGRSSKAGGPIERLVRWIVAHKRSNVNLQISRLISPADAYSDVRVRFGVAEDTLYLAEAHAVSDSGFDLSVSGRIKSLRTQRDGTFQIEAAGRSETGTRDLFDTLVPAALEPSIGTEWKSAFAKFGAPVLLAGEVRFAGLKTRRVSASISGTAGDARLTLNGVLESKADVSVAPLIKADLTLTNRDGMRLWGALRELMPGMSAPPARSDVQEVAASDRSGMLVVSVDGVPDKRIQFVSQISTPGVSMSGDGELRLRDGKVVMRSKVDLQAKDSRDFLGAGVTAGAPLKLSGLVSRDGDVWRIDGLHGKIDGRPLRASLEIKRPAGDGLPSVTGEVQVDRLSLPGALSSLVLEQSPVDDARPRRAAAGGPDVVNGDGTVWPDRTFSFAQLHGLEGAVDLSARRVELVGGLAVKDFRSRLTFSPSKLSFENASGRLGAGKLSGAFGIEKQRAGVQMDMSINGDDVSVRKVLSDLIPKQETANDAAKPPSGRPPGRFSGGRLSGRASFDAKLRGRALSLRGMATVLNGTARLKTKGLRVSGFAPGFVQTAAVSTLARGGKPRPQRLQQALQKSLASGVLDLGAQSFTVKIADGIVTVPPLTLDTAVSTITGRTLLSLDSMRMDSAWRVVPKTVAAVPIPASPTGAPAGEAGAAKPLALDTKPLPPMSVVFAGGLASGSKSIEPQIASDGLLRELTVRRLEQDVGELERLRKREQEIAEELERRRKIEEARVARENAEEAIRQRAIAAERARRVAEEQRRALEQFNRPQRARSGGRGPFLPPRPTLQPEPLPPIRN